MKNADNKYNTPMHNPDRVLYSVTKNTELVSDTPKLSWDTTDATSKRTRSWRWSESPEVELKTYGEKNLETGSKSPKAAHKSNCNKICTNSSQRSSTSKNSSSKSSSRKSISRTKYKSDQKSKDKSPKIHKSKRSKSPMYDKKRKSKKYD